jgi:hypothetical protein
MGSRLAAIFVPDLAPVVLPDEWTRSWSCGRGRPGRGAGNRLDSRVARGVWTVSGRGGSPQEPADVVAERRAEQEVLALRREQLHDPPDVGDEPHVSIRSASSSTKICTAEVHRALPDEVEEAARRGDEDLVPARHS